ncbi:hypothetical protein ABTM52_20825, partial [Acinetobacter baumannii]
ELDRNPGSAEARAQLAGAIDGMQRGEIRGIAVSGADGRLLASAGRLVDVASFHWPLKAPYEATVVWQEALVLHTRAP